MKVLDRKPMKWQLDSRWNFIEAENNEYYFYVWCESSFGYTVLIKLTDEEYREYKGLGWTYLQYLSQRINYFVDEYKPRRILGELNEKAELAIKEFNEARLNS